MLFRWLCRRQQVNGRLVVMADLFRSFSASFFGGGLLALFSELWVQFVLILSISMLFGSSRALTAIETESLDEAHRWTCSNPLVHLYLLFTSFCVAALIEESIKAFLVQYAAKLYLPHTVHLGRAHRDCFVWIGVAVGLGFGTMEGVLYVCVYGGNKGVGAQLMLWLIRAFIAIPFHSVMGWMWGTAMAQRETVRAPNGQSQRNTMTWKRMGAPQMLVDLHLIPSPKRENLEINMALRVCLNLEIQCKSRTAD